MASFYELTEEEVELLLESMEMYRQHAKFWTDKEVEDFEELRRFLKTRERPQVVFTED